jgi:hypothetical protein
MSDNTTSTSFDLRYLSFTLNAHVSERWGRRVLDILVIVVENQKERTTRSKAFNERLDAILERRLVDLLARAERIELLARSRGPYAVKVRQRTSL